jgi:uncharacterized protein (DUF2236 family)
VRAILISQRVTAERLLLLGWARAILLQLAHPLIAAGVFDHSGFRASPLAAASRLHHTVAAMLDISFGDEQASARAIDGIRAIHTRVHGTLSERVGRFAAGTPYSAEDPVLVLWVHATLVDTMVTTFEWLVRPLTADERDRYCAEAAWVATTLGARDADVPRTWPSLRDYVEEMVSGDTLAVGPQAALLGRALLWSPLAAMLPGSGWLNRLMTAALLPPRLRDEYGLTWNGRRHWLAGRVAGLIRGARHVTPDAVALWASARHLQFPASIKQELPEKERAR